MDNSFNLHVKLILLWWKHRKIVWTSQLNKHDIGCLEENRSKRVSLALNGYLNLNLESRPPGKDRERHYPTSLHSGKVKEKGWQPQRVKHHTHGGFSSSHFERFPPLKLLNSPPVLLILTSDLARQKSSHRIDEIVSKSSSKIQDWLKLVFWFKMQTLLDCIFSI